MKLMRISLKFAAPTFPPQCSIDIMMNLPKSAKHILPPLLIWGILSPILLFGGPSTAAASVPIGAGLSTGVDTAAGETTAPAQGQLKPESTAPKTWPQYSLDPPVYLPDETEFTTWEPPALHFTRTYYVNASHPEASDTNPGTEARPFATINHAAQVLQPGERVVVGPGIYRERIRPVRGGTGPNQMISYEAEPGTRVILRGSRVFSGDWTRGRDDDESNLWYAPIPDGLFEDYRPFTLPNVTEQQFEWMSWAQSQRGKVPFTLVRGLVFQDGRRLTQLPDREGLASQAGTFWVDRPNQVLHVHFFDDIAPHRARIEITTQNSVFAPAQYGLGFIRVKGFVVEHAAGPFPWEQAGAISPTRGHHWIIEDCTVRQVNGVGIDLGIQHPRWPQPQQVGFHIVRRNVITDCGICGICGLGPGRGREFGLRIEDNVVMRNAWHDAELLWETGGIKTHCNVRCLIQKNLVADTAHGSGIWMDWDNRGSRCSRNIVLNSHCRNGAIFVEASTLPNLVDQNIVWNTSGHGIYEHDSRRQIFAHNLVGHSTGAAFHLHGKITDRRVGGQAMTYGDHRVLNNLAVANEKPDSFGGQPSDIVNHLALPDGIQLDRESLELQVATELDLTRQSARVEAIRRDFFGNECSRTSTAIGPFAETPSKGTSLRLWHDPVPVDTATWLKARLETFRDFKFGFMMHWGAYSQWGCIESWPLVEADTWARPDDLKAWTDRDKDMERFRRDYWALPKTFNPVAFNPQKWADIARDAGMKYVVFTTKHHDGFAMFDTALSDYRITAPDVPFHTNARSNVVHEVFDAFRSEGFAIGAYFSKADWHCPDYWDPAMPARTRNPNYNPLARPEKWRRFVDFTHGQIRELMTGYGPIDILWLDAGQVRPPRQDIRMDRLAAMARHYQPNLIIVDRTVGGRYENYRTPEQEVPEKPLPYVWETCMTMGNQWSFKPDDNYKSTRRLIHLLVDIVGKGGNFLLNVGPQPNGELPAPAIKRLQEIGDWMRTNGEAIYATRPIAPYKENHVVFTRKDRTVYAICLIPPGEKELPDKITFAGLKPSANSPIHFLGSPSPLAWETDSNGRTTVTIPESIAKAPPSRFACTLQFEMTPQ